MAHWKAYQYDPKETPELLKPIECDPSVLYLWEYFMQMGIRRGSNGFAVNPITHEGLEAWQRRRRITLEPFEHDMLEQLEILYLNQKAKKK